MITQMPPTDIPNWQLPQPFQLSGSEPPSWVVVFLCKVDDEQYERILRKLCTLDKSREDAPSGEMRRLLPMPWIRDFTPPISVIFEIFEETNYTDGLIFIDQQSLNDDTVVILNGYYGPERVEAARVPMDRANLTLSASQGRSLAAVMPNFEEAKFVRDQRSQDCLGGQYEMVHHPPPHIPADFEPKQSTLSLISLVHLSEEDINGILSQPWTNEQIENVQIMNWPADEKPCSRGDLYRIFQAVKTPRSHDIDQAFAMFIDVLAEGSGPRIFLAQEWKKENERGDNNIQLSRMEDLRDAMEIWHMVWNPFPNDRQGGGVWYNDFKVNANLFYSKRLDGEFERIQNPDEFTLSYDCCLVFVLEKMPEKEVRSLWESVPLEIEQGVQFLDVSHLIKTPDMEGLMEFFESKQFLLTGQRPPRYLLAVDRRSLEAADGDDEDAACIFIAARKDVNLILEKPHEVVMREGHELYGCHCLGYDYDRLDVCSASEAATDLDCQNIESFEISEKVKTPAVTISNGTLLGSQNANYNQDFFLGIPYAQPPVGDLRYNHPKPINASWDNPRDATSYGFWCHSAPMSLPGFSRHGFLHEEDEDCLTLNVVRPSNIDSSVKLPVLVYIYGGGLQEGGSADQRYNMSFVVQESVNTGLPTIGVSFNYRVSGFGFLSGRTINESGLANLGLYDQRLALHWIQENIAAFGGDPSRVTIQGESSGALSVGYHLLAYGGRNDGLFRAAIAQSGAPLISAALASLDEQDAMYNAVLNATGCVGVNDGLGCLRRTPANLLKAAFQQKFFFPVMDGNMIAGFSSRALEKGEFVKVPLLIGTNTNEGTGYIASGSFGAVNSRDDFLGVITGFGPGKYLSNETLIGIINEYLENMSLEEVQKDLETVLISPEAKYGTLYGQSTLYLTDYLFNAPKRHSARIWARQGLPIYSYRFDIVPNGISPEVLGVCHFQDVAFTSQNTLGVGYETPPVASTDKQTEKEYRDASILMSRMWLSFVNTLSPNYFHKSKSDFVWPTYQDDS
ncbi:alpha/beta-hydrolase, partial [Aspergillus steynii IBT 23096]